MSMLGLSEQSPGYASLLYTTLPYQVNREVLDYHPRYGSCKVCFVRC